MYSLQKRLFELKLRKITQFKLSSLKKSKVNILVKS